MRYIATPTYPNIGGKVCFFSDPPLNPNSFKRIQKTIYQVQANDRMDIIASKFYDGRGDLWWIIAAANNLSLPTDLEEGMFIAVPVDYKNVIESIAHTNKNIS